MPLAAQLVGVSTGAKTCGFSHSQTTTAATGTRHHQPSESRLQIARIIRGIAANRVQTLQGLACRFQASSLMRNAPATFEMTPMWTLSATAGPVGHDVRRAARAARRLCL